MKAIFLDRDGVINKDNDLIYKREDVEILEGVKEALKKLKDASYLLLVISNQPVIARGLTDELGVADINSYINCEVENLIDKFYFCPHHPNADLEKYRKVCECRKPSSGMIIKAAQEFNIDLNNSWMIGDRISDIIAGKEAGCKTILIKSEFSDKLIESGKKVEIKEPDYNVKSLFDAVNRIISPANS